MNIENILSQETIKAMYSVAKRGNKNYKKKTSSPRVKSKIIKPEKVN